MHSGCLPTRRGGAWPLPAPLDPPVDSHLFIHVYISNVGKQLSLIWYWRWIAGIKVAMALHQESSCGRRKDEARPVVRRLVLRVPISGLTLIMVGWQEGHLTTLDAADQGVSNSHRL